MHCFFPKSMNVCELGIFWSTDLDVQDVGDSLADTVKTNCNLELEAGPWNALPGFSYS